MAPSPLPPSPLPMRWALILMAAVLVALLVGVLTFMEAKSWPATLLAALGAAGGTIPVLDRILGR